MTRVELGIDEPDVLGAVEGDAVAPPVICAGADSRQRLPRTLVLELNEFVRDKFLELWRAVHEHPEE